MKRLPASFDRLGSDLSRKGFAVGFSASSVLACKKAGAEPGGRRCGGVACRAG